MEPALQYKVPKFVFLEDVLWSTEVVLNEHDTSLHAKYKLDFGGINVESPHMKYDYKPTDIFDEIRLM